MRARASSSLITLLGPCPPCPCHQGQLYCALLARYRASSPYCCSWWKGKASSSFTLVIPGPALPTAAVVARVEGRGITPILRPSPGKGVAESPIVPGSPLPLPPGSALLCCLGLLSRVLLQVRGSANSPEHCRQWWAGAVLHGPWTFMWSPVGALTREPMLSGGNISHGLHPLWLHSHRPRHSSQHQLRL